MHMCFFGCVWVSLFVRVCVLTLLKCCVFGCLFAYVYVCVSSCCCIFLCLVACMTERVRVLCCRYVFCLYVSFWPLHVCVCASLFVYVAV